jgi:MHS family alpha-ketoglutarate permease-like MFS transporter
VGVILAGSVPNLVQWFNLYLYATFAPYLRTDFFDPDSPDSLIYVYGLFALTFVVRPLGSWLFGRLADTRGRQRALVAAVTMMSAGSVALAPAPTERAVGAWAAVIFVVVRLLRASPSGVNTRPPRCCCRSRARGATADSSPRSRPPRLCVVACSLRPASSR